jgi:hypothetical protein
MPRRSDEEESQLRSDSDYDTPPTDRRKCGAERSPFSDEGSSAVPSPVKEINFEKRGQAQEQSALCAAHVTPILHRPALLYPLSGDDSNSIPLPVKRIQAPQSKHIADDDEDEWEVIVSTQPIINKKWMHMILLMTFTDTQKILCMRAVW